MLWLQKGSHAESGCLTWLGRGWPRMSNPVAVAIRQQGDMKQNGWLAGWLGRLAWLADFTEAQRGWDVKRSIAGLLACLAGLAGRSSARYCEMITTG